VETKDSDDLVSACKNFEVNRVIDIGRAIGRLGMSERLG